METMDCKDIQALLSGLIDDQLDRDARHAAERHLVGCAACRRRLDEAEALDRLVAAEAEQVLRPEKLPEGFVGRVLSRTVYGAGPAPAHLRWTTWLGWVAAAAALVLALTAWVLDYRARDGVGSAALAPPPSNITPVTAAYRVGPELRSSIYHGQAPPDPTWTARPASFSSQDDAVDSDTLYAAALVLESLQDLDPTDCEEVERIRWIVSYDELLDKLAATRPRVDDRERPFVHVAEGTLSAVLQEAIDEGGLRDLRDGAQRLELARVFTDMSDRRARSRPF